MAEYPTAKIDSLLLTESADDFYSSPREKLEFDWDGIVGDARHRGATISAGTRNKYFVNGTKMRNFQQVSMIDDESLDHIGARLELDQQVIEREFGHSRTLFLARCIGANIVFSYFEGTEEIPEFHDLPNATIFGPYDPKKHKFSNASVNITRYNAPCIHPGKKIEEHYPDAPDGTAQEFVQAAKGRRGFVAMVAKTGEMAVGDSVMFRPLPKPND